MFITQANGVVTRVNQHVYLGEKMKQQRGREFPIRNRALKPGEKKMRSTFG